MSISPFNHGDRLYLDANILIYAMEGSPLVTPALSDTLLRIDAGELTAVTSELTLAEVLVEPLRVGNVSLQDQYHQRLTSSATLGVSQVTRDVILAAAKLCAPCIHHYACQTHSTRQRLC